MFGNPEHLTISHRFLTALRNKEMTPLQIHILALLDLRTTKVEYGNDRDYNRENIRGLNVKDLSEWTKVKPHKIRQALAKLKRKKNLGEWKDLLP
jgi:predicted glycosyltransferase involved in capsule biosynthesis